MSFLRRLFGGGDRDAPAGEPREPATHAEIEASERDRERQVLRDEAARLDDLRQRQLRYAEHAWTPPAQGGERRADDEEEAAPE